MSNSVWPHRRQPTRLHRPWDSPGKNTGVGCHFLRQCVKVKSESEIAQSCLTLCNPMDCILPGSSVHGIFPARVLEWGAIAFSEYQLELPSIAKHYKCLSSNTNVAVNIGMHVLFRIIFFSIYMPRNGTAGLYGMSVFSFLRNLHCSAICNSQDMEAT